MFMSCENAEKYAKQARNFNAASFFMGLIVVIITVIVMTFVWDYVQDFIGNLPSMP